MFLLWRSQDRLKRDPNYADEYPLGLPDDTEQFLLSDLVDGAIHTLQEITQPSFVYLHFWPPHASYRPTRSFYEDFQDGWQPMEKPMHPRSWDRKPYAELKEANQRYDEYLLSWDAEVSRLFQYLEESGLLDRSYVVITADHGELNERGEEGHFTPLIYEPLIHIPLIVFQPGQKEHKDVHTPTSSVDVLPTLAHLAGKPTPRWAEGRLLPGFGGEEISSRGVFSVDAKQNASFAPLTKTTIALTKEQYRLTYYNYPNGQEFEFYDLAADPEEMNNLFPSQPQAAQQMKDELLQKLAEVNAPFEDD